METLTLSKLREANLARHEEWWGGNPQAVTLSFRGNELAGETGEACNVIKKLERARLGIAGSRASLEDLADELADVVICADLCAMDAGVDLGEAVVRKFNATSDKVGMKTRLVILAPSKAARDVLAERERQISDEGYSTDQDDTYQKGELSAAAGCYALFAFDPSKEIKPPFWPWPVRYWKPKTAREDLVRAGALILAEIERLDRAAA